MEIKPFDFNIESIKSFKNLEPSINWPRVYIIENGSEYYVGETTNIINRTKDHLKNGTRRNLKRIHIIQDPEFNKSATLDVESSLIEYFIAEGKNLQNGNGGLSRHNYYDQEKYRAKFEVLWKKLIERRLAHKELFELENTDLFKYSPYKALTDDQLEISEEVISSLKTNKSKTIVVKGGPGTGKSVLATYLIRFLQEDKDLKHLKIGLVIPMTSFRSTLKTVFRKIPGLKSSLVIGPSDVVKEKYDFLIVDEAHRLKQRKNLSPGEYTAFDNTNKKLEINNGTQIDWILKSSKYQLFFYDEGQSVRPSDISFKKQIPSNAEIFSLKSQLRVKGGNEYMTFINSLLSSKPVFAKFEEYDFQIFDDVSRMVESIKQKDSNFKEKSTNQGLCRVLAGYAWEWASKNNKDAYDIIIGTSKLRWNTTARNWAISKDAVNEVGCIHTIQGYDLNIAGVIIGPELSYDFEKNEFVVYKDKYKDSKGKAAIENNEELKYYILNIYRVLLTRGIYGTYVYICDAKLRKYFNIVMKSENAYSTSVNNLAIADKKKKYNDNELT